jgi:hypothetical protein
MKPCARPAACKHRPHSQSTLHSPSLTRAHANIRQRYYTYDAFWSKPENGPYGPVFFCE